MSAYGILYSPELNVYLLREREGRTKTLSQAEVDVLDERIRPLFAQAKDAAMARDLAEKFYGPACD